MITSLFSSTGREGGGDRGVGVEGVDGLISALGLSAGVEGLVSRLALAGDGDSDIVSVDVLAICERSIPSALIFSSIVLRGSPTYSIYLLLMIFSYNKPGTS